MPLKFYLHAREFFAMDNRSGFPTSTSEGSNLGNSGISSPEVQSDDDSCTVIRDSNPSSPCTIIRSGTTNDVDEADVWISSQIQFNSYFNQQSQFELEIHELMRDATINFDQPTFNEDPSIYQIVLLLVSKNNEEKKAFILNELKTNSSYKRLLLILNIIFAAKINHLMLLLKGYPELDEKLKDDIKKLTPQVAQASTYSQLEQNIDILSNFYDQTLGKVSVVQTDDLTLKLGFGLDDDPQSESHLPHKRMISLVIGTALAEIPKKSSKQSLMGGKKSILREVPLLGDGMTNEDLVQMDKEKERANKKIDSPPSNPISSNPVQDGVPSLKRPTKDDVMQMANSYFESYQTSSVDQSASLFSIGYAAYKQWSRTFDNKLVGQMKTEFEKYLKEGKIGAAFIHIQACIDLVEKEKNQQLRCPSSSSLYKRLKMIQSELSLAYPYHAAVYPYIHKNLHHAVSGVNLLLSKNDQLIDQFFEDFIPFANNKKKNEEKNKDDILKFEKMVMQIMDWAVKDPENVALRIEIAIKTIRIKECNVTAHFLQQDNLPALTSLMEETFAGTTMKPILDQILNTICHDQFFNERKLSAQDKKYQSMEVKKKPENQLRPTW